MRKNHILVFVISVYFVLAPVPKARADMFGGDIVVLAQILQNNIQQLYQLYQVVRAGTDSLALMRDINRGINDSLTQLENISPSMRPELFQNIMTLQQALREVQSVYGKASGKVLIEEKIDKSVADSIALANDVYQIAERADRIADAIKNQSHHVSPGGAQKLTAQSLGVITELMDHSLRTESQGIKLQAEAMAKDNWKDKALTSHLLSQSSDLKAAMKAQSTTFASPRF